jgi:XRE family aerobic/anaerobic benzoate catabolism transcriptional regulator
MTAPHPPSPERANGDPDDDAFLRRVGEKLRTMRARRGVTRRDLSRLSRVSERYIAQLEAGSGNVSILLLRRIARALGIGAEELTAERPERSVERALLDQLVAELPEARLAEARALLQRECGPAGLPGRPGVVGRPGPADRLRRVALIGLRGAGKSTIGRLLAGRLGTRFIELDREIEAEGRMELSDLFAVQGQEAFRRLERAALERIVTEDRPAVIATGGGIVADGATYGLLLDTCFTAWLRATPEEHMRRVIAQGDMRPMRDNRRAMDDLRAILESREALYAKADVTVDTTGRRVEEVLEELLALQAVRAGRYTNT